MPTKIKEDSAAVKEVHVTDMDVTRSPGYRLVYSNFAQGGLSAMDVRITFSVIHETEPKKIGLEEQFTLIMALPFAEAVAQLIMRNLEKWQAHYNAPEQIENTEKEEVSDDA